jgi:hypothetical protein
MQYDMINKIDKERRHPMNAAPTRPSNKRQHKTIKEWFGISKCVENLTLAELFHDFITGNFDEAPSLKDDYSDIVCMVCAFVGKNKTEMIQVAADVSVGQAVGCLGNLTFL